MKPILPINKDVIYNLIKNIDNMSIKDFKIYAKNNFNTLNELLKNAILAKIEKEQLTMEDINGN
jgi:hypothetical protein